MKPNPSKQQRQDSLTDQMNTVIDLARQHGCYDAQDWIKQNFARPADEKVTAKRLALWAWGRKIPTEIAELEKWLLRGLEEAI